MISAFGVDHGGISKSLPSALKISSVGSGGSLVSHYSAARKASSAQGRIAAADKAASSMLRHPQVSIQRGKDAKAGYKGTLRALAAKPKGARVLP